MQHARAALQAGMHAPEVESLLVSRGLSSDAAAAAVDQALSGDVGKAFRAERRAFRWKLANRIVSATVGLSYIALGWAFGGAAAALRLSIFVPFPLALIWFGDEIGARTGRLGRAYITSPTPGVFVRIGGWVLLLLPVLVPLVIALIQR